MVVVAEDLAAAAAEDQVVVEEVNNLNSIIHLFLTNP
jgi:hypothetical protein